MEIKQTSIPASLTRLLWWWRLFPRRLTASCRDFPQFLIIGGQRCGSTTFFKSLLMHPQIAKGLKKEVHFFDNNFYKGFDWYKAHFPTYRESFRYGEASPYYIFHPLAPNRVFRTIPRIRLIAVLRNPVERAYSHYQHEVREGREKLTFAEAIDCEETRLAGEKKKIETIPGYFSFNHNHYSYLARGQYVEQLKEWLKLFPREQLLVLQSEHLRKQPRKELNKAVAFLGLDEWQFPDPRSYHVAKYQDMDTALRKRLVEHFKPYNQELCNLLDQDFDWS